MKTTNTSILSIMNILFWISFIGLCIKIGALLVTFLLSLFYSPDTARDLYMGLDLSAVYAVGLNYYVFTVSFLLILTALKAHIAYLIIRFFMKFSLSKPFGQELTALFFEISHTALGAGFVAVIASGYSRWLMKQGVPIPIDWSGYEILFFAGVIYLLALVFQKGTALQAENELTV